MSLARTIFIAASILLPMPAAYAQQIERSAAAVRQPPEFQGTMVDAKGKTVGRVSWSLGGPLTVVRQISGIWVLFIAPDLVAGYQDEGNAVSYLYQSTDCTGTPYLELNDSDNRLTTPLVRGVTRMIPPATTSSIYFAGPPATMVLIKSVRSVGDSSCIMLGNGGGNIAVGPAQSISVNSLGLTPPFSLK
jgi:hypothetical protein